MVMRQTSKEELSRRVSECWQKVFLENFKYPLEGSKRHKNFQQGR